MMLRTTIFVWAILGLATPTMAQTYTLKAGWPACASKEAFDEMTQAIIKQDMTWASQIPGCIFLSGGIKAEIKDFGFAVTEVYAHPHGGGRPLSLFVNTEALQR